MAGSQVTSFGASFYAVEDPDDVQTAVDAAVAAGAGSSPTPQWVELTAVNMDAFPYTPSTEKIVVRADAVHLIQPGGLSFSS